MKKTNLSNNIACKVLNNGTAVIFKAAVKFYVVHPIHPHALTHRYICFATIRHANHKRPSTLDGPAALLNQAFPSDSILFYCYFFILFHFCFLCVHSLFVLRLIKSPLNGTHSSWPSHAMQMVNLDPLESFGWRTIKTKTIKTTKQKKKTQKHKKKAKNLRKAIGKYFRCYCKNILLTTTRSH